MLKQCPKKCNDDPENQQPVRIVSYTKGFTKSFEYSQLI